MNAQTTLDLVYTLNFIASEIASGDIHQNGDDAIIEAVEALDKTMEKLRDKYQ